MYQLSSNKSLLLLLDLRNPLGIANSRRVDDSELPVSTRLRRSQVQLLARRLKGLGIFEQESLLKEGDIYRLALDLRFPGVLLSLSLQFCVPITRPRDHLALWLVEHQWPTLFFYPCLPKCLSPLSLSYRPLCTFVEIFCTKHFEILLGIYNLKRIWKCT